MPSKIPSTVQEPTDAELVCRVQRTNDQDAFKQLLQRHETALKGAAFRIVGNVPDAKDAVQEALMKVYEHRSQYRPGDQPFRSYLMKAVINESLQLLRRRKRRHWVPLETGEERASSSASLERTLEVATILEAGLARVSDQQAEAIMAHDLAGKTLDEMAEELGTPQTTLEARRSKGLASLRRWIARGSPRLARSARKGRTLLMRWWAHRAPAVGSATKMAGEDAGQGAGQDAGQNEKDDEGGRDDE